MKKKIVKIQKHETESDKSKHLQPVSSENIKNIEHPDVNRKTVYSPIAANVTLILGIIIGLFGIYLFDISSEKLGIFFSMLFMLMGIGAITNAIRQKKLNNRQNAIKK
jgi:hypothetical protein